MSAMNSGEVWIDMFPSKNNKTPPTSPLSRPQPLVLVYKRLSTGNSKNAIIYKYLAIKGVFTNL